ncbi:MAG: hypothetical protein M2R45_01967 [Verrucomicrobia subdivision 3 bacterium]|nr:hypothetical protein [Limisphaerales bacterium]MCS1416166.1 hypothetical protein [Limisphaerales bacterium]
MPGETRVELVTKNDPAYLEWVSRWKKRRLASCLREKRDPFAADYQTICLEAEAATLRLFSRLFGIEPNLVLKVLQNRSSVLGLHEFLEIDFVKLNGGTPILFGELKFSISPKRAVSAARKQLQRRIDFAKARWPKCVAWWFVILWTVFPSGQFARK